MSKESDPSSAKHSSNSHELRPLLNGNLDNLENASETMETDGPRDGPRQPSIIIDEIDEIYPVRFSQKDGPVFKPNVPVSPNTNERDPFGKETDSEEEDTTEGNDDEPKGTFEDPQQTECSLSEDVYVDDAHRWLGKSASLHRKHDILLKIIHYNRKIKMEEILNLESENIQVRLLTMKGIDGLTCLTKAVTRQSLECITSLLPRFESLSPVFESTNTDKLEALQSRDGRNLFHLAAETLNGHEIINIIEKCHLKERIFDKPDKNGVTPLITACKKGNRPMAIRLLHNGAKVDHVDNEGYSPIYLVALASCAETLNLFLVNGSSITKDSCSITDGDCTWPLLSNSSFYKNGGTILRAIVEGGTANTLEVCFGTSRKKQLIQRCLGVELQNNPCFLHRVCGTSLTDLVKLVVDYDEKLLCDIDSDGMTPLMRATEAGQLENVKLILDRERGRDTVTVVREKDEKTALMMACAGGYHDIARCIVTSTDLALDVCDNQGKNVFHYAAKHREVLKVLIEVCSNKKEYDGYKECLKTRDKCGDITLHIAAVIGSHKNVELLLTNGVPYNVRSSRMGRSSLHYAACSNLDTVKTLVEFVKHNYNKKDVIKFINGVDCKRQTSLHLAASLGHWKTVNYLLENGAKITCDNEQETPLHHAAVFGCLKTAKRLLKEDKTIIHQENRVGETAAMFAAVSGKTEVLQLLLNNKANLWGRSNDLEKRRTCLDWAVANRHSVTASVILDHERWKQAFEESYHGADGLLAEMVQTMPNIAIKVLDKCVTENKEVKVYDFFPLQTVQKFTCRGKPTTKVTAMKALENMANLSRDDCLRHKLVQKFLSEKWRRRARNWYMFPLFLYTIFLVALTTYIGLVRNDNSSTVNEGPSPTNSTIDRMIKYPISPEAPGAIVATVICVAFAGLNIIKELFQLIHRRGEYFLHFSTYMEFAMYICVFVFLFPLSDKKSNYQWQAGAVAIFLAWLNFIGFIKNFPKYGIYIIMAKKIFLTFVKVFIPLGFFIMAFAMTFFVLLRDEHGAKHDDSNDGFTNIARALVTSFAMMVGEINYRETFLDNTRGPNFVLTLVFVVLFMILITILLMNLLTGLAVGDTGEILRRAMTEKRIQQAMLIVEMDKSLNKYPCLRAGYIEPLRETPGKKTPDTWKTLAGIFIPDLQNSKKDEKTSFEREYYALKDQLDDITSKLETIQKASKENEGFPYTSERREWRRRQGYSI